MSRDASSARGVSSLSLRVLCHHPEGMRSLSPGLRGTSYPGYAMSWGANPERVASPPRPVRSRRHAIGLTIVKRTADATLSGLVVLSMHEPRVARASQPWAERCNPFGIARNVQTPRARWPSAKGQRALPPGPFWATCPDVGGCSLWPKLTKYAIARLAIVGLVWLTSIPASALIMIGRGNQPVHGTDFVVQHQAKPAEETPELYTK
jgi:hypothetical protein